MTSPKKAEWDTIEVIDGHTLTINNTARFYGLKKQVKPEVYEFQILKLIHQPHTDLLTTLKERVEGMKKKEIFTGDDSGSIHQYGNIVLQKGAYNEAVDDFKLLIDSLLVTDEKEV
jgi:hypothetical protein